VSERRIIELDASGVEPDRSDVLGALGVPPGASLSDAVTALVEDSFEEWRRLVEARLVWQTIGLEEFREVYVGDGENEGETPVEEVVPSADRLALFALTLGGRLSDRIATLFRTSELALACTLDAVASQGAERAVDLVCDLFREWCEAGGGRPKVLAYSPGYCGWNVTGQRRLFATLRPEEIGITLNSSCLMQPLKSVSGVLVAGAPEIHVFERRFECCAACRTQECVERMRK